MPKVERKKRSYADVIGGTFTVATCLLLLWDPEDAIAGGLQGLRIFGEIVLPSLLPFFVVAEVLIGLGLVHFLGALVEPLMRPLFNVPGTGSFVWSMGLAAGYPMDAVITTKLRTAGDCTRIEGERLLAFTNTADPLFLLGAVAVGMFGLPELGFHLATAHYVSAILVGLIFRFYGRSDREVAVGARARVRTLGTPQLAGGGATGAGALLGRGGGRGRRATVGYWRGAVLELQRARRQDGRAIGRLLADAMSESTITLLKICGFIMFASSLIRLMDTTNVMDIVGMPIDGLLSLLGWDHNLTPGVVAGMMELDVGTAMAADAAAPLLQRLTMVSAIIAWSGLSVHGQVASIVCTTDLRMGAYIKARLLHSALAALITMALFYLRPPALATLAVPFTVLAFSPYFRLLLVSGVMGLCIVGGGVCHLVQKRR